MRSLYLAFLAVVLLAARAYGQETSLLIPPAPPNKAFINVNAGFRLLSQEFGQRTEFALYDETGIFETQHAIAGAHSFEASAGVRIWRALAIGGAYSLRSKHTRDVTVIAQVPGPLFANRFRSATGTLTGLEHTERAVHVQALLRVPVTIEFDVTLYAGPTFFELKDELVESITASEAGATASTVNLSGIERSKQSHRTTGYHAGLDLAYMFMRRLGAGALLRYSRGSVDLELPPGSVGPAVQVDAGGLEFAVGVRLRF